MIRKYGLGKIGLAKSKGLSAALFLTAISLNLLANGSPVHDSSAKQASDSYLQVEVIPSNNESLQQIIIPFDIYQYSGSRYLNDLDVIDGLGNSLPFEISTVNKKVEHIRQEINVYPITKSKYLLEQTDTISYKYDSKDNLKEIKRNRETEKQSQIVGYLLDLGEKKQRFSTSINFKLSPAEETSFLRFDIDQSDNLKNWSNLARKEVLAQLEIAPSGNNSGDQFQQQRNQIKIANRHSRYLRLRILNHDPAFTIQGAELEFDKQQTLPLLWSKPQSMTYSEKEKGYILASSPSLPISKMQYEIPDDLSFFSGDLSYRTKQNTSWRRIAEVNIFRIKDDGSVVVNNSTELNGLRASELKLASRLSSSLSPKEINLKLAWQAQKITILTSGNPPYQIKVGVNKDNKANNQSLLTMVKSQVGTPKKYASLGERTIVKQQLVPETIVIDWAKIVLWFVLIVGVILMSWMAMRLLKKV